MEHYLQHEYITAYDAAFRLGVSALLGFLIGLEREYKDKPIGLRAFMLVAVGSTLFTIVTMELTLDLANAENIPGIDPSRVVQGIIGGIGFLGAGALIQAQSQLQGAATGAGIWVVGGVGIACGFGYFVYAIISAAIVLVIYVGFGLVSAKIGADRDHEVGADPKE